MAANKAIATLHSDEMRKRMRPFFARLRFTPEFLALAEELLFLVREYGVRNFAPDGPPYRSPEKTEHVAFASLVHEGWKRAHRKIADGLIQRLDSRSRLQQAIKSAKRSKDSENLKKLLIESSRLGMETRVLRRMYDVIPWTVMRGEHSTIRRLVVRGAQGNLSVANIQDAFPVAEQYNTEPGRIAICTDITSFIHVGDIFLFDVEDGVPRFIELKSGEKNIEMLAAAEFAHESGCAVFVEQFKASLSPTDAKHFERTTKQYARGRAIVDTINNETGIDPNTGKEVAIAATKIPTTFYAGEVVSCWRQLNPSKTWALTSIDECVHIGIYQGHMRKEAFVAFNAWMDVMGCTSPVYNITDSFSIPVVTPFGALELPHEMLTQILREEIIVVICLDVRAFMELGNELFPGSLSLASKKDSADVRRGFYECVELDGRTVRTHGALVEGHLGKGVSDRIVFDLHSPKLFLMQLQETSPSMPEGGHVRPTSVSNSELATKAQNTGQR